MHSPLAVSLHEKGVFLWPVGAWPLGDDGLRYREDRLWRGRTDDEGWR